MFFFSITFFAYACLRYFTHIGFTVSVLISDDTDVNVQAPLRQLCEIENFKFGKMKVKIRSRGP